jgi:hypothetical protein
MSVLVDNRRVLIEYGFLAQNRIDHGDTELLLQSKAKVGFLGSNTIISWRT